MHEISIAQGIFKVIEEELKNRSVNKVTEIGIVYGRLTTVVPEALEMAFEAVALNTFMAGAKIVLQAEELNLQCCVCNEEFSPVDVYTRLCPKCGQLEGHTVLTGKGLYVSYIEAE